MSIVAKKLREIGSSVLEQMKEGKNPYIEIPIRTLANVEFDEKTGIIRLKGMKAKRFFLNVAHARKFMQTMLIAAFTKGLIEQKVTTSIRDLYYALKHTLPGTKENTFEEQNESDPIIEDIEVMLDVLREEMHLNAERKGLMVGNCTIVDAGDEINLRKMGTGGYGIPSNVEEEMIKLKKIDADFVLVVEKAAVFNRLNEDKFWKKHNCILITGEGQPSRGVRRILYRLHNEFKLPVYVLTDADSWGYYIYSVIKQGSINLAHLSPKLGVPDAMFIGLTTMDVEKFKLPKNVTIKLNEGDIKRAKELLNYSWFKSKAWQEEINHMLKVGYKLELEALSSRGIKFISEEYLPTKIKNKDFVF